MSIEECRARFAEPPTYAPWIDHRRFMMYVFSRAPARARRAIADHDPHGVVGTSGDPWTGVGTGIDWWERGQSLDVVGRYATSTVLELENVRLTTDSEVRSVGWTSYDDPYPIARYRFWKSLGLGDSGAALFSESTLINPDLSLPEAGRDWAAALLPVRRGLGRVFAASRQADHGIFVLISPESSAILGIHSPPAPARPGYEALGQVIPDFDENHCAYELAPLQNNLGYEAREGIHELLAAMGVGWTAISPQQVANGRLATGGARVLLLPMCAGLSEPVCTRIADWVRLGGHVVADLLPGTFTEHGQLRGKYIYDDGGAIEGSTNSLDAVFGLTPSGRPDVLDATHAELTQLTVGGDKIGVRAFDRAATAMSAVALGSVAGQAAWFRHTWGDGTAPYLGGSLFADYQNAGLDDRAHTGVRAEQLAMEHAFRGILSDARIQPACWVTGLDGQPVGLCRFFVRTFGVAELIVLMRDYAGIYEPVASEVDAEVHFASRAHTYDVEHGVHLGAGLSMPLRLSAYTIRVLARLSYQVVGVAVSASGEGAALPVLGGFLVVSARVVTDGGAPDLHALRLDILDGTARALRYLGREALAPGGIATFSIPLAYNDPPGPFSSNPFPSQG